MKTVAGLTDNADELGAGVFVGLNPLDSFELIADRFHVCHHVSTMSQDPRIRPAVFVQRCVAGVGLATIA